MVRFYEYSTVRMHDFFQTGARNQALRQNFKRHMNANTRFTRPFDTFDDIEDFLIDISTVFVQRLARRRMNNRISQTTTEQDALIRAAHFVRFVNFANRNAIGCAAIFSANNHVLRHVDQTTR